MHYLIDGYNVINASLKFSAGSLEERRNKLISFVKSHEYFSVRKNSASIVFDNKTTGIEFGGYDKMRNGFMEIIFSSSMMTADDIIVEIADSSKSPRDIIVITNDKGIKRRIAPSGAKYESVEIFIQNEAKLKPQPNNHNYEEKTIENNAVLQNINKELERVWLKK